MAWWELLRNTELKDSLDVDKNLIHDYSAKLNKELMQTRFINTLAANAVYGQRLDTDFVEDLSDVLSNLNYNNAHKINVMLL